MQAKLQALSKGLRTVLQPTDTIDVAGTSTPAGKAADDVDAELARFTATDAAHTAYEKVKQARDAATPATLAHFEALEAGLRAKLGVSNPDLTQFGLKPKKKRAKLTAQELVEAQAKANATRAGSAPNPPAGPSVPPAGHTS
jgi:hypothetical protein